MGLCQYVTFAFMHHPYLVCILFGMPSLHLFTFLMFFYFFLFSCTTNSCLNNCACIVLYAWLRTYPHKLSERRLYLDLCTMFKIVHGLFHFPSGLTRAELQVLIDPFCFIDPSPALTTSITHLSIVQSPHYHSHLCLIVTYTF